MQGGNNLIGSTVSLRELNALPRMARHRLVVRMNEILNVRLPAIVWL